MTTNNIPPCPVCGVVPELVEFERPIWVYCCGNKPIHYSVPEWSAKCTTALATALRDLRIETVAQVRELSMSDKQRMEALADYIETCIRPDPEEIEFVLNPFDSAETRGISTGQRSVVEYLRRRAAEGEK